MSNEFQAIVTCANSEFSTPPLKAKIVDVEQTRVHTMLFTVGPQGGGSLTDILASIKDAAGVTLISN